MLNPRQDPGWHYPGYNSWMRYMWKWPCVLWCTGPAHPYLSAQTVPVIGQLFRLLLLFLQSSALLKQHLDRAEHGIRLHYRAAHSQSYTCKLPASTITAYQYPMHFSYYIYVSSIWSPKVHVMLWWFPCLHVTVNIRWLTDFEHSSSRGCQLVGLFKHWQWSWSISHHKPYGQPVRFI